MRKLVHYRENDTYLAVGIYEGNIAIAETRTTAEHKRFQGQSKALVERLIYGEYATFTLYSVLDTNDDESAEKVKAMLISHGFEQCKIDEVANVMAEGGMIGSLPKPHLIAMKRNPIK